MFFGEDRAVLNIASLLEGCLRLDPSSWPYISSLVNLSGFCPVLYMNLAHSRSMFISGQGVRSFCLNSIQIQVIIPSGMSSPADGGWVCSEVNIKVHPFRWEGECVELGAGGTAPFFGSS